MYVVIELILLVTPDADLGERVRATFLEDPAAASEAVALLADDDRVEVLSTPVLMTPVGEPARVAVGRNVPFVDTMSLDPTGRWVVTYQDVPVYSLEVDALVDETDPELVIALSVSTDERALVPDREVEGAWRFGAGDVTHYDLDLVAHDDRYTWADQGDLTVIARAWAGTQEELAGVLDALATEPYATPAQELGKRARRRAIDDLLIAR